MRSQNLQTLSSVLLAAAAVAVSAGPGWAEAPPQTPRWFAELTDPTLPCADWQAEESKRIVAHRGGQSEGVVEFITPGGDWGDDDAIVRDDDGNAVIDLRSTIWAHMPVIHVTESSVEEVRPVYWLQEDLDGDGAPDDAAPGATTQTGPDGHVMPFLTIRIAQVPDNDPSINNRGKHCVTSSGSSKFCIAVGLFQK